MNAVTEILARRAGSRDAALVSPEGDALSFADLADRVERTANALTRSGIGDRDRISRVGLLCPDGSAHVVLALAVLRAGACLVPIAPELTPRERADLARRVALDRLLLVGEGQRDGTADALRLDLDGVEAGLQCFASAEKSFAEDDFSDLAPAFVRFSSGTTGAAKGILLSHATLLERLGAAQRALGIRAGDRVVWLLPMAHHFVASILLYLWSGATILLVRSPLAADVLDCGRRGAGTVLYASPFHHAILAAEPSGRPWPDLRLAFSTATALPAQTAKAFHARYGKPLSQVLGIMEVGLAAVNRERPAEKPDSIGRPVPGFEIEVRDEQERPVEPGGVGELHLRGPGMLDAYLSPWKRRDEVLRDGWFATGDLAVADADGDLRLVGRTHSVIDVGGLKCFPEEIEAVLAEHPEVRAARVAPRRHERVGAVPVAEIVPADPGRPPDAATLSRHCQQRLARYKIPVEFRIVSSLASTASGKLRR
jgi:long-chain acyl-CoA synthetase